MLKYLVPVLLGQVGRAVHCAAVADYEAVPVLSPGQREVSVFYLEHRPQQVLLNSEGHFG